MLFHFNNHLSFVCVASNFLLHHIRHLSYVDRMKFQQKLHHDDTECSNALESCQFIYYHKNRAFIRREKSVPAGPLWIPYEATHHAYSKMKERLMVENNAVLVDVTETGIARFAIQVHPLEDEKILFLEKMFNGKFEELKILLAFLRPEDAMQLTKARSLLFWHMKTNFCSNCGRKVLRNIAGTQRICTACRTVMYPTLSPCVIVLVNDKQKCLLVRQPTHITGMYTAIGGFIEPGETPEDALRREVAEEVGLEIDSMEYLGAQHWAFPMSSLMFGFLASTKSNGTLNLDRQELEDARWFDLKTVKHALDLVTQNPLIVFSQDQNRFLVPPPGPIAHTLLQEWVKKQP